MNLEDKTDKRTKFWRKMTALVLEYDLYTFDPNIKELERDLMKAFDESQTTVYYGTKYPDPRPCTKNSHFIEHEQSDCGCGYTATMRKTDDTNNL